MAVAAALTLPAEAMAAPVEQDYLRYVHPDLRQITGRILTMFRGDQPLNGATLTAQRDGMKAWVQKPRDDVPYERKTIPGGLGQPSVTIYVINAKPGSARPALLHTHGGGYVMGSAADAVRPLQDLCVELGCAAVSVDYRLAPEITFAGSIEDNYAGLKWLHANAPSLGVDPARIAVMGESAGGGHAALLAITARDRGEVPLAFQCLTYPMLDDRTGAPGPFGRPVPDHVGKIIWNAQKNGFGWGSFLGARPGGRSAPKGAVPARLADLKGLPPAWIGVGTIDLFHDEDVDYAQRLNAAGVATELIVVPGGFHGFDGIGTSSLVPQPAPISVWFVAARKRALRQALGIPG